MVFSPQTKQFGPTFKLLREMLFVFFELIFSVVVTYRVGLCSSIIIEIILLVTESASFGRRGMLSVTTIPFFLNLHESLAGFHADAAE